MMNFKATKQSLALISLCCCSVLYGTINHFTILQPSPSSSMTAAGNNEIGQSRADEAPPISFEGCPSLQQQPRTDFRLTYAAFLPGVNTYAVSALVQIMTGLQMINADSDQRGGIFGSFFRRQSPAEDDAAIRHTQYPYLNNRRVEPSYYGKDGGKSRVFIVMQNPLRSIPLQFQSLDIKRNWMAWSEDNLDKKIVQFQRFICYWLDRYTSEDRLLLSYEGIISDQNGVSTVLALNGFLGGALTDVNIAACIWQGVIENIGSSRRRLDVLEQGNEFPSEDVSGGNEMHPQKHLMEQQSQEVAGQHSVLLQYPYTVSQLSKMLKMLHEVAQRYKDEDQAYSIMMAYHEEILIAMSQLDEAPRSTNSQLIQTAAFNTQMLYTEPLEICGRRIPFPLETETKITQHYSSQCPLFNMASGNEVAVEQPTGMLLIRGYERFGRTGNNLIEFLHALQYGKENNVIVGIMLDSWPIALITKFWMAFPTDNLHNDQFLNEGILKWKSQVEKAFCIKVFLNEEELSGYDNIISMTARELFMFKYTADVKEYIQFQKHNIRMLFRSYNSGVGKDIKNRNVGNLCSVIDGIFGEERQSATYSVIHSRSLEGEPGLRLLGILSGTSGCDPVAALNMEPEYIKGILTPLGLMNHPILFISDNQRPEILEKLLADSDIGPQIRLIPPELSWVGGDLAVAIMSTVFVGNPASTFSGFIAKSRIALGFDNNYLFRAKKDGEWVDSCEERCIFYKWVMRSMA